MTPAPTEAGNRIRRETVVDLASFTDQNVVNRKTAIGGGLAALAALALPGQVRAQAKTQPDDSFVVLLKGLYQPVTHGPNLGLSTVDLNDGSYSTTRIYPVEGTPGGKNPTSLSATSTCSSTVTCVRSTSSEDRFRCSSQGTTHNIL